MSFKANKISSSLLYRLTDESTEPSTGSQTGFYIDFNALQVDIKNNLENVLNSRPFYFGSYQGKEIKKSILNYGIPDFSQQHYHLKKYQQELCQVIKDSITHFEPRLQKLSVNLVDGENKNTRNLTIRIVGTIVIKADAQQAVFESNLDVVRYKFTFEDEV